MLTLSEADHPASGRSSMCLSCLYRRASVDRDRDRKAGSQPGELSGIAVEQNTDPHVLEMRADPAGDAHDLPVEAFA